MKYSRFEDLPVWKEAARLFVAVDALCVDTQVRLRGDLGDQLHRAALSVSNNIAEGFEEGTTQQLLTYLYHARGSAGEVRSMLQMMMGLDRLKHLKSEISNLRSQAESVSRQLRAFADAVQNSPFEGQRYLTQEAKDAHERSVRREAFIAHLAEVTAAARDANMANTNGLMTPSEAAQTANA